MKLIAEVGLNHMGSEDYADEYLKRLVDIEFDGVEFQVREPAFYEREDKRGLLLSDDYYARAAAYVHGGGLHFGIALGDAGKVPFFERLGVNFYKVLSRDIGNRELIAALLSTGKPVWVSTGQSDEVAIAAMVDAADSAKNLRLIHTAMSYEACDVNLRAIQSLQCRFGLPVGFGLHSTDALALFGAAFFNPAALFVYVKGERAEKHPDEKHAIGLARLEELFGSGEKEEMRNKIPDQRG